MAIIPVDVQKVQKVAPPRSLFTFRVQGSPGGLFGHSSMTFVVPKWSKYLWILNEKAWFFRSQISMNHYKSSTGWGPPVMCCCWFINHQILVTPMKTSSSKIYHKPWFFQPQISVRQLSKRARLGAPGPNEKPMKNEGLKGWAWDTTLSKPRDS